MTGDGMVLIAADGRAVTVMVGDRVRLANGMTGVAHQWTEAGVCVRLDRPHSLTAEGLEVWGVVAGDWSIEARVE